MRSLLAAGVALVLAGCAKSASDIAPAYVSPIAYTTFSCQQLAEEAQRVASAANRIAGVQDQNATNDAVATGVALVLFWPAAFMIKGDGATAQQLADLKGKLDAIEQQSIAKNCGIEFRPQNERKALPT